MKFWSICSESAKQLTELLRICPWDRGGEIAMDYTHMGDLILHWNVYISIIMVYIILVKYTLQYENVFKNEQNKSDFLSILWILIAS